MSQKALIYSMLLICLNISIINSQIPTLNPSQTVNLATGEMQFSLPLGTVQGVSGHDFPVTLNYKAGIRVSDEASPAGLGFSYGAGSIYRKVVYVPDDCKGGMKEDNITPRYYSTPEPDESDLCKTAWWVYFLTGISIVISLILMCIPGTQWAGSIGANITMSVLTVLSVGLQTMQGVIFTPNEYIAGGTHLPSYAASSKPGDPNYGKGYWCGGVDDVPDVYFVNCPYISGELVIAKDSKGEKYFSLRQTNSSSASANLSVKIEYNHSQESFLIILSDGTRLFFEQGWYSKFYNATFWQYLPTGGTDCSSIQEEMLNDSLPNQWMLTKVLFPDFTDLDGDENPGTHPEMNRGSWILFKYDVKEFSGVSQLPFSSQGVPQTSVVSHSNGYLMDIYLDSIITPNQYAKFFYGNNRLDALWFNTADFVNWPKPVSSRLGDVDYWDGYRNREPVSTLLKASNSSIEPLERNVLDSIVFYSADKIKLRKATLNTDYTLRPKCINSYSKDVIGNFVPFSGNSEAASLTLKSLVISGNNNDALFKTIFEYLKPEAEAWQSNLYNMPEGCDNKSSCEKLRMAYYIENRDLFGYYLQNLTMNNDFNESGIEEKTRMSDAWSLQKVTFSTGSSILWHYEPKRYTFANGIQLTDESQNPQVKYGGGIRVRSIDADDGLGNVKTTSYFYTQMPIPGNFEETSTNSCGHATVLPFPYLLAKDQDKRPDATRGGLYTPVKINYEQVIVAENYEWGTHVAPNGYNVYKFITSKDYPNIGQYGAIDFGWKRGMIDTICMYNKSNKLISQEVREYDYTYNNLYKEFWNIPWLKSSNVYPIIENTYGTVRLKKSIQKTNNVENSTSILFANDLHTTSKDKITSIEKEIRSFDIGDKLDPYPGIIDDRMVAGSRVSVCKTTGLGDNNSIDDYIVVRTDGNTIMQLCIGKDVLTESSSVPAGGNWSKWIAYEYPLPMFTTYQVIGTEMLNVDGNANKDLVVVIAPRNFTGNSPGQVFLDIYIFHDINVDPLTNYPLFNDGAGHAQVPSHTTIRNSTTGIKTPVGCHIGNFYEDGISGKIDILLLSGMCEGNPGDYNEYDKRQIYSVMDVNESEDYITPIWSLNDPIEFYGHCAYLTAKDADNSQNDLVITGPGSIVTNNVAERPFYYQIYKDIEFKSSDKKIILPPEDPTCDSDCKIFQIKPNCEYGWDEFQLGGAFNDEVNDRQQFVFPEWSNNGCHFYIANYLPVTIESDYNGVANRTFTKNSVGDILVQTVIPAFTQSAYKKMGDPETADNKNMLVQSCGSVTYKFAPNTPESVLKGDLSTHAGKIVSANASTWTNVNNTWLPCANYSWQSSMGSTGLPLKTYIPFNYSSPQLNDHSWRFVDSICKFSKFNLPIETAKQTASGGRLKTSIIYGHRSSLTVGTVVNSNFEECGVFTCNYDLNENVYFDKENLWEKGAGNNNNLPSPTVELSSGGLFCDKSIHVINAWGPTRNFRLTKGRDYIMTAWVKVVSGKAWMSGDLRHKEKSTDTWPTSNLVYENMNCQYSETGPTGGKWVLMKMKIPASSILADKNWETENWYARVFVGAINGGDVYINDIRFSPAKSHVSSIYYDMLSNQPVLTIDENNKPSQKVSFDGFGRPVKWEKINIALKPGDPGFATTVQEKRYFVQGEGIFITKPSRGETYGVNTIMQISWQNEMNRDVNIYYSSTNSAPWTLIQSVTHVDGQKNYTVNWNIPNTLEASEQYGIKIVDVNDNEVSDQTGNFSIQKIVVLYPTKGSVLLTGMPVEIRFNVCGDPLLPVTISVNGTIIESNAPNNGKYIWNIPVDFTPSDNAHVKIIVGNNSADSESFIIKAHSNYILRWIYNMYNYR